MRGDAYVPVALTGVPVVALDPVVAFVYVVSVGVGALVAVFVLGPVDIVSSVAVFACCAGAR